MVASSSPPVSPDQFAMFEHVLTEKLLAIINEDKTPRGQRVHCVCTDYNPNQELAAAAEASRIEEIHFPWKTRVWLAWSLNPAECYVEVAKGYGGKRERLPV